MKYTLTIGLLLIFFLILSCEEKKDDVNPTIDLGVNFILSNAEEININTTNPDNGLRIYFPNHFRAFTGFDATRFDYVSALSLYPVPPSNANEFLLDIAMVIPTTDELMEAIQLPIVSDKLFIASSPDSSSIQSLFSISLEIERETNNLISYYSTSNAGADSLKQTNSIDKIELLKERANSYLDGSGTVFTDYYVVSGQIETLMRAENLPLVSDVYPEYISLKGSYTFVVEVRDTK